MGTFKEQVTKACRKYVKLLGYISTLVSKFKLDLEKHMKHYVGNYEKFKENDETYIFKFIIKNYLHIMPEVVDHNVDYFLTQKPYIIRRSKRGSKKKPNTKATYVCDNMMLRYILHTVREAPKDNKVANNDEIRQIFGELVQIFDLFHNEEENHLVELRKYVNDNFSGNQFHRKMCLVLDNYATILEDDLEEEEVSSDDEGTTVKKSKKKSKSSSEGSGFDFASGLLKDSSIGKLAQEISKEINPDELKGLENIKDQGELIKKLFNPGEDGNTGFGNIMNKIISKVGSKLQDGSINQESMQKEAGNLMSSLGGLGGLGGSDLFKNMFK